MRKLWCWLGFHETERREEDFPMHKGTMVRFVCKHCYTVAERRFINGEGVFTLRKIFP